MFPQFQMRQMSIPSLFLLCYILGYTFGQENTCPPLSLANNTYTDTNVSSVNTSSDPVHVHCTLGYVLDSGETTQLVQCEAISNTTAQWNSTVSDCSPVTCTDIPAPVFAHVQYSSTTYGSEMSVVCESGRLMAMPGQNVTLTCGATGSWEREEGGNNVTLGCGYTRVGYLGCYQTADNITTTGEPVTVTSEAQCVAFCRSKDDLFAALKGDNCYCHRNLTSLGILRPNSECVTPCDFPGDSGFCGGLENRLSVYKVFDGCYSITDASVFASAKRTGGRSKVTCLEYCRGMDYTAALVNRNNWCQCVDIFSNITALPLLLQMCEQSVSNLEDLGFTVNLATTVRVMTIDLALNPRSGDSCVDLYKRGVMLHGHYYTSDTEKEWCQFLDGTGGCDEYWVGYQDTCYHFSYLQTANFNDSLDYCLSQDAHLASVHSQIEEDFIEDAINYFGAAQAEENRWYLGLYDSQKSASFQWTDGTLTTYTHFLSTEPSQPFLAQCIVVRKDKDDIEWYDQICDDEWDFICKKQTSWSYGCIEVTTADLSMTMTHSSMTITMCSQKCLSLANVFSAVEGDKCYCFDTMTSHTNVSWTSCDIRCPGNSLQICGGVNTQPDKSTIFVTGGSSNPGLAESCEDLEVQGLTEDTFETSSGSISCTTGNAVECPFSWLNLDGHCYKFIVGASGDIHQTCAENGAYVASFEDSLELQRVRDAINSVGTLRYYDWWTTGLVDFHMNKVFRWSNGQYFNASEFQLVQEDNARCNAFDRTEVIPKLVTIGCNGSPFVCEKGNEYAGCFNTPEDVPLLHGYADMTISLCVELCRGRGKQYAMLDVTSCWCNDVIDTSTAQPFSSCGAFCLPEKGQACGGDGYVSVYDTAAYPEYAVSCGDLYTQGILVPGTYKINGQQTYCTMKDNSTCPSSSDGQWIGLGSNGSCLMFGLQELEDEAAMAACRGWGGVVASAGDQEQWDFLRNTLKYSLTLGKAEILLGARDQFHQGLYSWADGSIMTFGLSDLVADLDSGDGSVVHRQGNLARKTSDHSDYFMCSMEKEYLGCYEDMGNLEPIVASYSSMTLTLCRQLCLGQNLTVALVHIDMCKCTDDPGLLTFTSVTSSADCEVKCQGHHGQNCGSGTKVRAYRLEKTNLATSCSDLYSSGVLYKGDYLVHDPVSQTDSIQQCGFQVNDFECPPGWIAHNRSCLQFIPLSKSQKDASEFCFVKGGYLFTPKTATISLYLFDLINSVPVWARFNESKWRTGAREVMKEGHVVTSDGMYMMSSELVLDLMYSDSCVVIDGDSQILRRHTCDDALPFVCEIDKVLTGCLDTTTAVSDLSTSSNQMSVSQCMETCRGQQFTYFGLQNSTCYCYNALAPVSTGACLTPCPAHLDQQCGGGNSHVSVYLIEEYNATKLTSCEELHSYGVTLEGRYSLKHLSNTDSALCFNYGIGYSSILGVDTGTLESSSDDPQHPVSHVRLGSGEAMPSYWLAGPSDSQPWIGVTLPDLYLVKAVFTQGGQSLVDQSWITQFTLEHKIDGDWTTYPGNLVGNTDRSSISRNFFADPFLCLKVKLRITGYNLMPALRLELIGETYTDYNHGSRYIGCFLDVDPVVYTDMGVVTSFYECFTRCSPMTTPFLALVENVDGGTSCKCGLSVGVYGQTQTCAGTCTFPVSHCGLNTTSTLAVYRTYEKHCWEPRTVVNATRTVSKVYDVAGVMTYGTVTSYTCITGHEFPDTTTSLAVTCKEDNTWSSVPQDCQVKHCAAPGLIFNGNLDSTATAYNSTITYTCDLGHETSSGLTTQTIVCLDSKTWSAQPLDCQRVACAAAPVVNNSVVLEDTASLVYGDTLTYRCHTSSSFPDNSTSMTSTCGPDGQWSALPPRCQYYQCPDPPYVAGAQYEYLGSFDLKYTCTTDYEFADGSKEVNSTCGADNSWSSITTSCVFSASGKRRESQVCLEHSGKRIVGNIYVASARSSLSCGVHCLQNPACRYYNYNNDIGVTSDNCQLFVDTIASFTFVNDSEWDAYGLRSSC